MKKRPKRKIKTTKKQQQKQKAKRPTHEVNKQKASFILKNWLKNKQTNKKTWEQRRQQGISNKGEKRNWTKQTGLHKEQRLRHKHRTREHKQTNWQQKREQKRDNETQVKHIRAEQAITWEIKQDKTMLPK